MFQFRRFPSYAYLIQRTMTRYCRAGFPHSEISGSMRMCRSPKLIAACHVLHRLLMPRHSPCALISLTYFLLVFAIAVLELCRLHIRLFFRNCNCFTLLKVPQFIGFAICLSVALLSSYSLCSVFKVQKEDTLLCTLKIKHCKNRRRACNHTSLRKVLTWSSSECPRCVSP